MRYKFLWQAPIAVCTLSKVQPSPTVLRSRGNLSKQLDQLQQDMTTLNRLIDISKQLKYEHQVGHLVAMASVVIVLSLFSHQSLDNVLRDMVVGLKEDMEERKDAQEQSIFNLETSRVNLLVHSK